MRRFAAPVVFLLVYPVLFAAIFAPWMWLIPADTKKSLQPWLTALALIGLGLWLVRRFRKKPS